MDDENKENILPYGSYCVHKFDKEDIHKKAMVFAGFNGAKDLDKCQIVTGATEKNQTIDESNGPEIHSLAVEQEKGTKIVQDDSEKEYVPPKVQNIGQVSKDDTKAEKANGNREFGLEIQPPNDHLFNQQDLNERDSSDKDEPELIDQEYYVGGFGFSPPQAQYESFEQEDHNNAKTNANESKGDEIEQESNTSVSIVSVIPAEIQVVAVVPGRPIAANNVAPAIGEDLDVEPQPTEQDPKQVNMTKEQDLGGKIDQDLNGSIEVVAEIPPEVQIVALVPARHNGPPVNGKKDILDKFANR